MARSGSGGPQLPLLAASEAVPPRKGINSLFFALQPDAAAVDGIRRMVESLRTRLGIVASLRPQPVLHVTLAYLGSYAEVPQVAVASADHAARTMRCAPFELQFDRVMTFPHPMREALGDTLALVLCREEDDRCEPLDLLQGHLVRELKRRGIAAAREHRFRPHLTLLYDRKKIDLMEVPPVTWTVHEMVLIYSLHGQTSHQVLKRYLLG